MPPGKPKGLPKTGGRQKGTPNKNTGKIKDAIVEAFHKVGGAEYLVKLAKDDPKTFASLIGRCIPTEIKGELEHDGKIEITWQK